MDFVVILRSILSNQQVTYLVALIVASLVLGIAAALATSTFRLANVADFGERHLIPVILAYCAAGLLAWANPELIPFRDLVFAALVARLVASMGQNLRSLGLPVPTTLSDAIAKVSFVSHVPVDQVDPADPKVN